MSSAWVILTLVAAILVSTSSILEKKTLLRQHAMEFITVLSIFTALITLPFLIWSDKSALTPIALLLILVSSIIVTIAALYMAKALRHVAISLSSPLLVLTPLVTLVIASIFLGEKISWLQGGGIIVLIIGAYLLESQSHQDILEPFKHMFRLKPMRYALVAVLLYGISSVLDKKIVGATANGGLGIPTFTYLPLAQFIQAIMLIVMMLLFHDGFHGIEQGIKKSWGMILIVSVLLVASRFAYQFALSLPGVLVSLLVPIKKLSTMFTTIIGGELFHEKHVLRRAGACCVMIIGAVLILL